MEPHEVPGLSVAEKQALLRNRRTTAIRLQKKNMREGIALVSGAGKGFEPDPLCECHNRNPCPIDVEMM